MSGGAYVSVGIAARWLGLTTAQAKRWVQTGKLEGVRVCGTCASDEVCRACRYYAYRAPLERRLAAAKSVPARGGSAEVTTDGNDEEGNDEEQR
jgi:hypothetical protein